MVSKTTKTWPCFMCLKTVKRFRPIKYFQGLNKYGKEQHCGTWFCLQHIFSYVDFNPFEGHSKSEGDFTVPLCVNCFTEACTLSKLCMQMQSVKIKLERGLQSFTKILVTDSSNRQSCSSSTEFQIRKLVKEHCIQKIKESKSENVRRPISVDVEVQTIDQCQETGANHSSREIEEVPSAPDFENKPIILESVTVDNEMEQNVDESNTEFENANEVETQSYTLNPTVSESLFADLNTLQPTFIYTEQNEPINNPIIPISLGEDVYKCDICGLCFNYPDLLNYHISHNHQQVDGGNLRRRKKKRRSQHFKCSVCSQSFSLRSQVDAHTERDCVVFKTNKTVECSFCHEHFETPYKFYLHKTTAHIEQYFISSKPVTFTDENFNLYCDRVVVIQMSLFKKTRKSGGRFNLECHYCQRQFTQPELARVHLLNKHQSEIVESEFSEQKMTLFNLELNSPSRNQSNSTNVAFICPECCISFSGSVLMMYHQAYCHPETWFVSLNINLISKELFRKTCSTLLMSEISGLSSSKQASSSSVKVCHYCSADLCGETRIAFHLLNSHLDVLAEKLKRVLLLAQ